MPSAGIVSYSSEISMYSSSVPLIDLSQAMPGHQLLNQTVIRASEGKELKRTSEIFVSMPFDQRIIATLQDVTRSVGEQHGASTLTMIQHWQEINYCCREQVMRTAEASNLDRTLLADSDELDDLDDLPSNRSNLDLSTLVPTDGTATISEALFSSLPSDTPITVWFNS